MYELYHSSLEGSEGWCLCHTTCPVTWKYSQYGWLEFPDFKHHLLSIVLSVDRYLFPWFVVLVNMKSKKKNKKPGTPLVYLCFYLIASGLGCGTWDLPRSMQDPSLLFMDSAIVVHGVSSCSTRALFLWGSWDLSSLTKDQTPDPCLARQILDHWTTREVPSSSCWYRTPFFP